MKRTLRPSRSAHTNYAPGSCWYWLSCFVVIDDGMGGFEHNAAIHSLGRDGRLRLISDLGAPKTFVEQALALQ